MTPNSNDPGGVESAGAAAKEGERDEILSKRWRGPQGDGSSSVVIRGHRS